MNVGRAMDALYAYFTPQSENKIIRTFPQPASNILRVQLSSNESSDMFFTFYDVLGRPTMQSKARVQFAGQPFIELNVEELSAGLYMMEVQSETQKFAQLVMINK